MVYDEHEQVVDIGRWPVVGPVDWLTLAAGVLIGGVLVGMPLALLVGLPAGAGFVGGTLLVAALVAQWGTGIALLFRLVLLARWLIVRKQVLDFDAAAEPEREQVRIRDAKRDQVIIKRGQP